MCHDMYRYFNGHFWLSDSDDDDDDVNYVIPINIDKLLIAGDS